MRVSVSAAALSLLILAANAEAAPKRVVSLNLCTDELVMLLAAPQQIASVTFLSHQRHETELWHLGRKYSANDGSLLNAASFKPDLIVTMGGGARDRQVIARRLGVPLLDLPYPQRLADVQSNIALVARALGRSAVGGVLNAQIDSLRRAAPHKARDTIWLGGGGRTVAHKGLAADWMRLAGLGQRAIRGDRISLERLLVDPPQILLRSDYRQGQYSGEQRWLSHPLAARATAGRTISTDGRSWTCLGPSLIPEIARLKRDLAS